MKCCGTGHFQGQMMGCRLQPIIFPSSGIHTPQADSALNTFNLRSRQKIAEVTRCEALVLATACLIFSWLVVWNIFLFSHILGIIIPIDFHLFQRSRYTTNQSHLFPFSACKNPNAQGRTSGPPLGSPCHGAKTETQRMLLGCGCVALQGTQIPGSYGCSIWI